LRRVYEASRLYINFFQPTFKLKSKHREGARVHKQYELPDTPYRRLLAQDNIAPETKEALKQQMEPLDPVLLLKHIRDAQDTVMALSENRTPEVVARLPGTPLKVSDSRPSRLRNLHVLGNTLPRNRVGQRS